MALPASALVIATNAPKIRPRIRTGVFIPMGRRPRLEQFAMQTAGLGSLVGGLFTAGIGTANNQQL